MQICDIKRTAHLEAQIQHGMHVHDRAAKIEATAFRALKRVSNSGSTIDIEEAEFAYQQAYLRADACRKALIALTDELGYVPRRPSRQSDLGEP